MRFSLKIQEFINKRFTHSKTNSNPRKVSHNLRKEEKIWEIIQNPLSIIFSVLWKCLWYLIYGNLHNVISEFMIFMCTFRGISRMFMTRHEHSRLWSLANGALDSSILLQCFLLQYFLLRKFYGVLQKKKIFSHWIKISEARTSFLVKTSIAGKFAECLKSTWPLSRTVKETSTKCVSFFLFYKIFFLWLKLIKYRDTIIEKEEFRKRMK